MQVKKHRWKKVLPIILALLVVVALLHTKFAVRCMLVGRLSWEIAFSSESDADYVEEMKGLVFHNRNSLIWLRHQAWTAEIERRPLGMVSATVPAPAYYVGNTFIGDDGKLSFMFLITTYYFYIDEDIKLRGYASDSLLNGSMAGIEP